MVHNIKQCKSKSCTLKRIMYMNLKRKIITDVFMIEITIFEYDKRINVCPGIEILIRQVLVPRNTFVFYSAKQPTKFHQ